MTARSTVLVVLTTMLSACAQAGGLFGGPPPAEVTVDYDPAATSIADADLDAHRRCAAYGATAVFVDETTGPDGRLRHRHYLCE